MKTSFLVIGLKIKVIWNDEIMFGFVISNKMLSSNLNTCTGTRIFLFYALCMYVYHPSLYTKSFAFSHPTINMLSCGL